MDHELPSLDEATAQRVAAANESGRTPVVFMHGLWLLPSSWDRWAAFFESGRLRDAHARLAGRSGHGRRGECPSRGVREQDRGQVADHYVDVIGAGEKPAVIGHSFGGLLAQILAGRGLSAVTVAIDPAPFRGVLPLPLSALKVGVAGARQPGQPQPGRPADLRAVPVRLRQRRHRRRGARSCTTRIAVPASGAPLFQAAAANINPWTEAKVEHQESRARPSADHLRREGPHGAAGDRERIVQEAEAQQGVTEFMEIPGRGHALTIETAGAKSQTSRSPSSSASSPEPTNPPLYRRSSMDLESDGPGSRGDWREQGHRPGRDAHPGRGRHERRGGARELSDESLRSGRGRPTRSAPAGGPGNDQWAGPPDRGGCGRVRWTRRAGQQRRSRQTTTDGFLSVGDDEWLVVLNINFLAAVRATRAACRTFLAAPARS